MTRTERDTVTDQDTVRHHGLSRLAHLVDRGAFRISQAAGWAAGLAVALMAGHILVEITLRLFGSSTFVMDEIVGYEVAAMTFLAAGLTFRNGQQIRVSLLLESLHGLPRRVVEILCVCGMLSAGSMIAWFFWLNAQRMWVRGVVSQTTAEVPLWIPAGIILVGGCVLLLQAFGYLLHIVVGGAPMGTDAGDKRIGSE